jgi:hypothetical protein
MESNTAEFQKTEDQWPEFARRHREALFDVGYERSWNSVSFPGLVLKSQNAILRGERKCHRTGAEIVRIAAREALASVMSATVPLYNKNRFGHFVEVSVYQLGVSNIDPGNLFWKPVVDILTGRNGGLGVIPDDSARYIKKIGARYSPLIHQEKAVVVIVRSVGFKSQGLVELILEGGGWHNPASPQDGA